MNSADLAEFKEILVSLRTTLTEELKLARESSQPVKLDQQAVGRVSRIDAIQQQQMAKNALASIEGRLKLIESALHRIDEGTYGECVTCEEPISRPRLEARPESPFCISCAR